MSAGFLPGEAANANAAILVDEVGIETGIHGHHRIRTAYRPVFRRLDGMQVEPVAVVGSGCPFLGGRPVDPLHFASALGGPERAGLDHLVRTLAVRNLRNLGADGISLFVDIDLACLEGGAPDCGGGDATALDRIVCCIPSASLLDRHDLVEHTLTLRAAGCGIAIGGFGAGPWDIACLQAVRPDIVRLDPIWFRRAASNPQASRLLVSLVGGLHDQGADILIGGIADAGEFQAALDCGADLFEGDYLGRPTLAGVGFDTARVPLGSLPGASNVVPLFA
ncbi:MAG: EAL domain-containing protein [Rhizobiaceae bacterium]|nr:EAL domain-containing protein [Rhizobiaceae bacterium]